MDKYNKDRVLGIAILIFIFVIVIMAVPKNIIGLLVVGIVLLLMIIITLVVYEIITKKEKDMVKKIISTIKPTEEFKEIYTQLYINNISKLEKLRKKAIFEEIFKYTILSISVIGFFIGRIPENDLIYNISILLFLVAILFTIFSRATKKYKENYKTEIIGNFVKLVNNNLEYMLKDGEEQVLLLKEFKESRLETKPFNEYKAEDYIEGNLSNNVMLKMADINVKNIIRIGKERREDYIFTGIFAVTTATNGIDGYIKIAKNKILKFESNTHMDSVEFEKEFDVFTDNEILAMQILTPDIMESLLEFKNKYDIDFEIAINKNKVYLRFFVKNMFEPKIFGNSMDKELLLIYYVILDFIIKVTEKINKVIMDTAI